MTSDSYSFPSVILPLPQPHLLASMSPVLFLFQNLCFNIYSSDFTSLLIFPHILVLALIAHGVAGIEGLPPPWEDPATLPCYISNPFL